LSKPGGRVPRSVGRLSRLGLCFGVAQLFFRPSLRLREHTVQFDGVERSEVRGRFQARLADNPDVVVGTDDVVVARFAGKAGPVPFRTVEVVRLLDDRASFEHLRGPFVRCEEVFELRPGRDGTAVTHSGTFTMRGGLIGWLGGLVWVRGLFERHIAAEMDHMAADDPPR
jgi:hypothetical protein